VECKRAALAWTHGNPAEKESSPKRWAQTTRTRRGSSSLHDKPQRCATPISNVSSSGAPPARPNCSNDGPAFQHRIAPDNSHRPGKARYFRLLSRGSGESDSIKRVHGSSGDEKERIVRNIPATDGLRPYQTRALASAHLKRITIREIAWNIARVADRDIRTLFSQLDVVAVIFETMRKQARSTIFAARHDGEQHEPSRGQAKIPGDSTSAIRRW
jgi:hypothetical protein